MIKLDSVGKKSEPVLFEYDWKDCVLYALGIGAQEDELPFIYEGVEGGLKVFPTFAVIPAFEPFVRLLKEINVNLSRVLHGEHKVILYRAIPEEGKVFTVAEIKGIYDKKRMAQVVAKMETRTEEGTLLFDNEFTLFCLGEGGFGGGRGPAPERFIPPKGKGPDLRVAYRIPSSQAALYRLNGDTNPLHIDPEFARRVGFERPILHGLCSFGYSCRAIQHGLCEGDVNRFKEFKARFSDVVYPGDTIITEAWREDKDIYIIRARTERGVVMNQAYARISP